MTENNNFTYYLASAIIKKLLIKGLITDIEYDKIDAKNKISFLKNQ